MGIHSEKPSTSLIEKSPKESNLDRSMIDILNLLFNENKNPRNHAPDVSTGFGSKSSAVKYHGLKQNRIGASLGIKNGSIGIIRNALDKLKKYELIEFVKKNNRSKREVVQITEKGIVTFKELQNVFSTKEEKEIKIPKFLHSCKRIDENIRAKDPLS